MLKRMKLKALYEEQEQMTLPQSLVYRVLVNLSMVVSFFFSVLVFKTWVFTNPLVLFNWK